MARSSDTGSDSDSAPASFEDTFRELQEVVSQLEQGAIGLEASMQLFERGTQLLRQCYQRLEAAEQRIELLTGLDADGNPITQPFDASATGDTEQPQAGRRDRSSVSRPNDEESTAKRKSGRKRATSQKPADTDDDAESSGNGQPGLFPD